MGLFSPDWKTDKPKKLAKALAWLEDSTNQELGTIAVEAPLEEVALAACDKLPDNSPELADIARLSLRVSVVAKALSKLASAYNANDLLEKVALGANGGDAVMVMATQLITSRKELSNVSKNSPSKAARELASEKLRLEDVAEDPATSPAKLLELARAKETFVRAAVAKNESTPPEILVFLADDQYHSVRVEVARNERTPAYVIDKLAFDLDFDVGMAAASHPSISPETLTKLAFDEDIDRDVRYEAAENPSTPPETLVALAQIGAEEDEYLCASVASNPSTPTETLRELADRKDDDINRGLSRNTSTPPDILARLANNASIVVRRQVADNPSAPPEALIALADEDDPITYECVASNPSSPPEALKKLLYGYTADVGIRLAENPSCPPDVLVGLARHRDSAWVRSAVARHPAAPPEILEELAHDDRKEVQEALAERFGAAGASESADEGYTEKDNMGTRQETFSQAQSYWMIERLSRPENPPFTLFTFPKADSARAALLELPYIHKASDSGKLICDRLMTFGYYEVSDNGKSYGFYEALVTGYDFTLDEFNQAEDVFKKHGGTLKSHDAPETTSRAQSASGDASKVKYKETTQSDDGKSVYEVYTGPDQASAMAFLKDKPVSKKLYFIVVETPEGNFGRDIMGIYQE
ncbi:MAG: hypothetical protein IJI68_13500 [Eggerthellaceae bacterium]|nr:hypothetical protein [Eggerthellaceae bacterium]